MRSVFRILLVAVLFMFVFKAAYAQPPVGYQYDIPIHVTYNGSTDIYNYPIIVDLNLQKYSLNDYNDILPMVNNSELHYSKEILPNGLVRLYIYFYHIPPHADFRIDVYTGNPTASVQSLPLTSELGTFVALRFKDGPLGGSTWTPAWSEISGCNVRYWRDGGRDAFDDWGYPRFSVDGTSRNLTMSPYASCNPKTISINGYTFVVNNYAWGYESGQTSEPHNPGATHQRIWVQEILPLCETHRGSVNVSYTIHGNLGTDWQTHHWEFSLNTPYGHYKYYEVSAATDPSATTSKPQLHFFGIDGKGDQGNFVMYWTDNMRQTISYSGIPTPIYYMAFVGDVHNYVGDWLANNIYVGPACYVSDPPTAQVEEPKVINEVAATIPSFVLRNHTYTIYVRYDGQTTPTVITDYNQQIPLTHEDGNLYVGTWTIDKNVSVGDHKLYIYIGDVNAGEYNVYVQYGGTPSIGNIQVGQPVNVGSLTTVQIPITCIGDACYNVHTHVTVSGCEMTTPDYDTGLIDENSTKYAYATFICYHASTHTVTITATSDANTITREFNIEVANLTADISPQLSSPDIVDPYAQVSFALTANGYDGNVTLSIVDSDGNPVIIVPMQESTAGIYAAKVDLNGLADGQYTAIASGSNFHVAKVFIVSSYAFMNPYGVIVEDEWGKPASIMYATVDGNYLHYVVKLINPRTTPLAARTDEWLSNGGIIQLPSTFAPVVDTITVKDENNQSYTVVSNIYGGSIAVVWSSDTHVLMVPPGETIYTITMKSPYVTALEKMYADTHDPQILNYLQEAESAQYAYQQAKYYLEAKQYMYTAMYGGISVDVTVPPEVVSGQSAKGFVYIKNSAGPIDPDSIECKIINAEGNTLGTCHATRLSTGSYSIDLNTSAVGTYGVEVTTKAGTYVSSSMAYYHVDSQYQQGKIVVTNFVIAPNHVTKVIYAQDPSATVTIYLYSPDGTLVTSGTATYNSAIGAFVYDLNVGNVQAGDYIVVARDSLGYSDRAIIHVSPILENILASVNDVNAFLHDVIKPKLDVIEQKEDNILDGQQNLYQAVAEVNANTVQIINMINQLDQNLSDQHAETIEYLQELNTTAYQILQTVNEIKQKIDNVVIVKLNQILSNQSDINTTVTDIKLMADCNKPSAVCTQLQAIEYELQDLNSNISTNHQEVVNNLSTINSKIDTLQSYSETLEDLLDCDSNYPQTSLCAKADLLHTQVEELHQNVTDMNAFLNQIYSYIRNDLTNQVISVGHKVEDLNTYLHGDVWNQLVDTYQQVTGLYNETNRIETLIQGHDATMQAQVDALRTYLSEVNSDLYTHITNVQNNILSKLDTIQTSTTNIQQDTNTLLQYFVCAQPNEVCSKLDNIYSISQEINTTNYQIIGDVRDVNALMTAQFILLNDKVDSIDSNVQYLEQLLKCDNYPRPSVCSKLDDILTETNTIRASIRDVNEQIFDLYHQVESQIDQVHEMAGGGGGGGPTMINPIKVVYHSGTVLIAVPPYIPPGKYAVQYSGDLYKYVKSPKQGATIDLNDGIIKLTLLSDADGVITGEVRLIQGIHFYPINVQFVADNKMNQTPIVQSVGDTINIQVPQGGAKVVIRGKLANCVPSKTFYFNKGGTYHIKKTCNADGVVEIIPNALNQSTIQVSVVNQQPIQLVQAGNLWQTTILPMMIFFVAAYAVTALGLI